MEKDSRTADRPPQRHAPSRAGRQRRPRGFWSRPRGRLLAVALVLAAVLIGVRLVAASEFDWGSISRAIIGFNPVAVFVLMAVLPPFGFSISVVYLVAGVKFGPLWGGVAVAAATACHLLITEWVVRGFLRRPLDRFIARHRHRIPEVQPGERGGVCVLAVLVPGLPYFARNYLLALADIPLRVYFWICLPLYVAHAYVTILLGDLGGRPDRDRLLLLGGIYVVKLGVCAWVIARLRERHRRSAARRAPPA